jgi:hypothetical protein
MTREIARLNAVLALAALGGACGRPAEETVTQREADEASAAQQAVVLLQLRCGGASCVHGCSEGWFAD